MWCLGRGPPEENGDSPIGQQRRVPWVDLQDGPAADAGAPSDGRAATGSPNAGGEQLTDTAHGGDRVASISPSSAGEADNAAHNDIQSEESEGASSEERMRQSAEESEESNGAASGLVTDTSWEDYGPRGRRRPDADLRRDEAVHHSVPHRRWRDTEDQQPRRAPESDDDSPDWRRRAVYDGSVGGRQSEQHMRRRSRADEDPQWRDVDGARDLPNRRTTAGDDFRWTAPEVRNARRAAEDHGDHLPWRHMGGNDPESDQMRFSDSFDFSGQRSRADEDQQWRDTSGANDTPHGVRETIPEIMRRVDDPDVVDPQRGAGVSRFHRDGRTRVQHRRLRDYDVARAASFQPGDNRHPDESERRPRDNAANTADRRRGVGRADGDPDWRRTSRVDSDARDAGVPDRRRRSTDEGVRRRVRDGEASLDDIRPGRSDGFEGSASSWRGEGQDTAASPSRQARNYQGEGRRRGRRNTLPGDLGGFADTQNRNHRGRGGPGGCQGPEGWRTTNAEDASASRGAYGQRDGNGSRRSASAWQPRDSEYTDMRRRYRDYSSEDEDGWGQSTNSQRQVRWNGAGTWSTGDRWREDEDDSQTWRSTWWERAEQMNEDWRTRGGTEMTEGWRTRGDTERTEGWRTRGETERWTQDGGGRSRPDLRTTRHNRSECPASEGFRPTGNNARHWAGDARSTEAPEWRRTDSGQTTSLHVAAAAAPAGGWAGDRAESPEHWPNYSAITQSLHSAGLAGRMAASSAPEPQHRPGYASAPHDGGAAAAREVLGGRSDDCCAKLRRLRDELRSEAREWPAPPENRHMRLVRDGATQTKEEARDLCVICLTNPRDHAYAPCGHRCVCKSCGQRQLPGSQPRWRQCPLCREPAFFGVFQVHQVTREQMRLVAEMQRGRPVPEWRRRAASPMRAQRVQGEALADLQDMLRGCTHRPLFQRPCVRVDATMQTDPEEAEDFHCILCQDNPATHAALPCGHLCLCAACAGPTIPSSREAAAAAIPMQMSICPMCPDDTCFGFVRIYL